MTLDSYIFFFQCSIIQGGRHLEQTKAVLKSHADQAFRLKDYKLASKAYGVVSPLNLVYGVWWFRR